MDLRESILKVLREELKPTPSIRRRVNFAEIDKAVKSTMVSNFKKNENIEKSIDTTLDRVMIDAMPEGFEDDEIQFHKIWHEIKTFIRQKYTDDLRKYFEKRQNDVDGENNEMGYHYIFVKHDTPYLQGINWQGFKEGFNSFDDMITKYGNWIDVDWDEVKQKLDNIKDFPENTFTGRYNSAPLRISKEGDEGNTWGYNFSVVKSIPKENLDKILKEELGEYSRSLKNARKQGSGLRFPKTAIKNNPLRFRPYSRETVEDKEPKVGTGKKPEGSGRRLYTDENPNDTVSVKFRTKEDIVNTLNKESFKSKPHKRQSQIINLIHQRVRAAHQNAKDPETKERLKRAFDYIEKRKEQSKEKTIKLQKEGLLDTSWENDKGEKITLMDLLDATQDIPVSRVDLEDLKPHLLTWEGDEEEIKKIEKADLQYPILIFVEDDGTFISIIDGHHRAQKAVRNKLKTIKAKVIPINSLPKNIRKVFGNMGKQEQNESELTEKCWAGYEKKGMKTMFGKRYPNCVKKTK